MEGRKKGRNEREGRKGGGREGNKRYRAKEKKKGSDTKERIRERSEWGMRARERRKEERRVEGELGEGARGRNDIKRLGGKKGIEKETGRG